MVAVAGVMMPSAVLLSFSVLMLFALPGIIIVIVVAGVRYRRTRDKMMVDSVIAAVLLVLVRLRTSPITPRVSPRRCTTVATVSTSRRTDNHHMMGWLAPRRMPAVGKHLHDFRDSETPQGPAAKKPYPTDPPSGPACVCRRSTPSPVDERLLFLVLEVAVRIMMKSTDARDADPPNVTIMKIAVPILPT